MINKVKKYFSEKERKLLIILWAIFFLFQLIKLDQLFLLRGERDIVLTGYSLAKTGRDLYGNFLPLYFKGLDMPTPFLSFYYSALFWLIIPIKSVFFAKIPFVLLSLISCFLIFEVILFLTKNKKMSLLTTIIFLFSPGYYHLSRLALEINLAFPLILFFILFYLKRKKFLSFSFLILTFFTYNGFRPLLPVLLIYLDFYFLMTKKYINFHFLKNIIMNLIFFGLLFIFSFNFIDGEMMRSRKSDLIFWDFSNFSHQVNFRRNTAIGPEIFKIILNNKITASFYYIIDTFFKGQNFDYLFVKGDYSILYGTTFTGQFWMTFLVFYYLGFLYLGLKWKKDYFYILGLGLISLFPSLINIDYISFSIRSILTLVSFSFLFACGMFLFFDLIKKTNFGLRFTIFLVFLTCLFFEITYFGYNYFFRRPITMSEIFFQHEKNIAQFLLNFSKKKEKVIIYDDSPRNIYANYVFFDKNYDIKIAQKNFNKGLPYSFGNFLLKICPSEKDLKFHKNLIIADSCLREETIIKLSNNPKVKKIPYEDFSKRYAYFIFE